MVYSINDRKRAIELLEKGCSVQKQSKTLGVNQKTLYNWKKAEERGQLETNYPAKRGAYRINEAALKAHLEEHPDAYLAELAVIVGGSIEGVRHALKKQGMTRKKRCHSSLGGQCWLKPDFR